MGRTPQLRAPQLSCSGPASSLLIFSHSDLYKRKAQSLAGMASSGLPGEPWICRPESWWLLRTGEGGVSWLVGVAVLAQEDFSGRGQGGHMGRGSLWDQAMAKGPQDRSFKGRRGTSHSLSLTPLWDAGRWLNLCESLVILHILLRHLCLSQLLEMDIIVLIILLAIDLHTVIAYC